MTNKKIEGVVEKNTIQNRINQLKMRITSLEAEIYATRAVIGELTSLLETTTEEE